MIDRSCSKPNCPHVQYRNVEIISHPGFQPPVVDDDIALLKLDRDVIFKGKLMKASSNVLQCSNSKYEGITKCDEITQFC